MLSRDILFHDIETYSEIDLRKVGASRYARHPSTEILMISYALNDGRVETWDALSELGPRTPTRTYKRRFREAMPRLLRECLDDPEVDKSGWNAGQFERVIFQHALDMRIPADEFIDTMVLALTCSFPGKLELALKAAGFDEEDQKLKEGKALINYWSKPRTPTKTRPELRNLPKHDPPKWKRYLAYNAQDVHIEREFRWEFGHYDLSPEEYELWLLDQRINDRGLPINQDMVDNALRLINVIQTGHVDRMKKLTGLDNPNSGDQLLPWLRDGGYPFTDLKKGHVARATEDFEKHGIDPVTLEVLVLRQQVAKASVKKYAALAEATDADGYLRYALQFAAAGRTWRWGGRKYQPQNLARPYPAFEKIQEQIAKDIEFLGASMFHTKYGSVEVKTKGGKVKMDLAMDALSTGVRPVVQAKPGKVFLDADLNAIENRVLGWIAHEDKILQIFRDGKDPYIAFAAYLYGIPYDVLYAEYQAGDKTRRGIAKPGTLGCGYMLSAGAEYENEETGEIEATGLLGYAWNMGIRSFTLDDSIKSVEVWRRTFRKAVQYWYDVSEQMFDCIASGRTTYHKDVEFRMRGDFMELWLPSDRCLKYHLPKIMPWKKPWGDISDSITYMNLNDRNQWVRVSTHPGKITENIDQAISRDLLAHGMKLAEKEGIPIHLHVHDQIVGMVDEKGADEKLRILIECMSEAPRWAKGLPLRAEGHVAKFFIKD